MCEVKGMIKVMANHKEHLLWVDLLKIFSIFMVIVLHVSSKNMYMFNVGDTYFTIYTMYSLMTRWAVPVFFMCSGALMLHPEKELSFKKMKKSVLRLVFSLGAWSVFYAIFNTLTAWDFSIDTAPERIWNNFCTGAYHLWFLFVLIGLYLIVPFLKKITCGSKKELEYFLFLACLFSVIVPLLEKLEICTLLVLWLKNLKVSFVAGYVGLFVLGYYLRKYPFCKNRKSALICIAIGTISLILSSALTFIWESSSGMRDDFWQENLNITVLPQAFAIFSLGQYISGYIYKKRRICTTIKTISSKIFVIYLCHDIFITLLTCFNFDTVKFNPIWSIPLISIAVFSFSFIIGCVGEISSGVFKKFVRKFTKSLENME